MSDAFGLDRAVTALSTDLDRAVMIATVGLAATAVGYVGGSVLAGESLGEYAPLLTVLAACTAAVCLALRGPE